MTVINQPIVTSCKILLTDSRFLADPANSIFFAIKGVRHDGHKFILELYNRGVRNFVIEEAALTKNAEIKAFTNKTDINIWIVNNSIRALQEFAANKRQKFNYPVVGITGSNGKTIVKEWLSGLLDEDFRIVKSPRSYNSQIGVALSVWEMSNLQNLGIFEAGVSLQGEMQNLEAIIKPTIGIFTNIGSAHSEGFKSIKQKITEKLWLFKNSEVLIYNKDYHEIDEEVNIFLKSVNPEVKLIGWSDRPTEQYWVDRILLGSKREITLTFEGEKYSFFIPFLDGASFENAVHCAFAALYLAKIKNEPINIDLIFGKFKQLRSVAMRLELKQGINDNYLIDDSYNNDFGGLKMALNFMIQQHTKRSKVLILSDIFQSGMPENELYESVANLLKTQNLEFLILVGPKAEKHQNLFENVSKKQALFFENTEALLDNFNFNAIQSSLLLIKGARIFEFEKIVNQLITKVHGTVLEINLDAITHNLNFYRDKVGSSTKLMVMVKAFAYGSGSTEVASWLQYHRVDYLAVAYPDEGVILRNDGIMLPIMVLNADVNTFAKVIEYNLEPEIYSTKILKEFVSFIRISFPNEPVNIHLKIDTGMHRLGFIQEDFEELIDILQKNTNIKVSSIFSHLVGADEEEHIEFSKRQIENFQKYSEKICEKIGYKPLLHICNSAGIIRYPEAKYDMVRLGIGLYGVDPTEIEQKSLAVVGSLKTTVSQIKTLKEGDTVGYSRKGKIEKETKIATLAIGYADGYDRRFGRGAGQVSVNGVLCPTVGNVCMDMTMIDVTHANCKAGDQVVIFGENPSIINLSKEISTIPYELLTGVSERVKRVFYHE